MRLIWSDRSWDEYVDWQNKDKKVIEGLQKIVQEFTPQKNDY